MTGTISVVIETMLLTYVIGAAAALLFGVLLCLLG